MSELGIKDFAKCLSVMQEMRCHLLKGDNQDILLGQMLHEMKELTNKRFIQETIEPLSSLKEK